MSPVPRGVPLPARPEGDFSFTAIGDYGDGSAAQARTAAALLRTNPDLVLTLGDNVYQSGDESNWQTKWDGPDQFGTVRATVPVRPAIGNHDIASDGSVDPYLRRFPELEGRRWYSFDHGGVHFVALDSTQSLAPGSAQHDWLGKDLARQTREGWTVLYLHHPLLGAHSLQSNRNRMPEPVPDRLGQLGPLLARHGVDLVLAGHEHQYERSVPINEAGTVQVVAGTGGAKLYPNPQPRPWNAATVSRHGFLKVDVGENALTGSFVADDGSVLDRFQVWR